MTFVKRLAIAGLIAAAAVVGLAVCLLLPLVG